MIKSNAVEQRASGDLEQIFGQVATYAQGPSKLASSTVLESTNSDLQAGTSLIADTVARTRIIFAAESICIRQGGHPPGNFRLPGRTCSSTQRRVGITEQGGVLRNSEEDMAKDLVGMQWASDFWRRRCVPAVHRDVQGTRGSLRTPCGHDKC